MRFFVDGLIAVVKLTNNQCSEIEKVINGKLQNVEEMFSETSSLLSGLLDCAGIVLAPKLEGFIKHIEFVPVSNEKALVILVTETGIIENRSIEVPKGLPASLLVETTNYLNSIIKGKTLQESKKIIINQIKDDKKYIDKVTKNLIEQGFACWDNASKKNKLIVTGTSNF